MEFPPPPFNLKQNALTIDIGGLHIFFQITQSFWAYFFKSFFSAISSLQSSLRKYASGGVGAVVRSLPSNPKVPGSIPGCAETQPLPVPTPCAKSTLQSMLGYYGRHRPHKFLFYFTFYSHCQKMSRNRPCGIFFLLLVPRVN